MQTILDNESHNAAYKKKFCPTAGFTLKSHNNQIMNSNAASS